MNGINQQCIHKRYQQLLIVIKSFNICNLYSFSIHLLRVINKIKEENLFNGEISKSFTG